MRKFLAPLAAALLAGAALTTFASPAQARPYRDCPYPYVCLYEGAFWNGAKLVQYRDTYQQSLPANRRDRADSVVNTRNDDSVLLIDSRGSDSRYLCVPANTRVNLGDYALSGWRKNTWANDVDAIRIRDDNGLCDGTRHVTQGKLRPAG
ncbi:peptidase inhibitor family I36 protein [Streptomyces sp. NPDC005004]